MENTLIQVITSPENKEPQDAACNCSFYYGCRIKGALLEGYMDGIMAVMPDSSNG